MILASERDNNFRDRRLYFATRFPRTSEEFVSFLGRSEFTCAKIALSEQIAMGPPLASTAYGG
ncbi:hypothetical protein K239x_51320 [Planctomycetes bacterium K23_9]|uniref:Uncharacterized protein n=1 Tax=Stieleria marina TaxID=1930275 RepID=A0A517P167_9BACT|nr:hypothetical protein K239x_51320 [Planctomycetes bacterium K23_9]